MPTSSGSVSCWYMTPARCIASLGLSFPSWVSLGKSEHSGLVHDSDGRARMEHPAEKPPEGSSRAGSGCWIREVCRHSGGASGASVMAHGPSSSA